MEKLDIILWILGGQFALMMLMWNNLSNRMDKFDDKLTDIDRRLCRLEGAFSQKECCMLKHDSDMKKIG